MDNEHSENQMTSYEYSLKEDWIQIIIGSPKKSFCSK